MQNLDEVSYRLNSLVIFRKLLSHPIIIALENMINYKHDPLRAVGYYASFVNELYKEGADLGTFIYDFIMEDDNIYIKAKAKKEAVPQLIEKCLREELLFLQELSLLSSEAVREYISYEGFLPKWYNSSYDLIKEYEGKIQRVDCEGYGIFSKYYAFNLKSGELRPVKYVDSLRIEDLEGYERERSLVLQNTRALLQGEPANNVLLYGDAGTGKSTTIKSVLNELKDKGLRLVEVKKMQLFEIPELMDMLADIPMKFIIFIDDLSFSGNDDSYASLKAVLEGGVATLGKNTVIYATSNRRHLMKETFGDRNGDELHLNDTIQENMSLSSRFGLTITFTRPDKSTYLRIVRRLAKEYGLNMPEEELILKAEAHAIRCNGRSARAARQFVELQKSHLQLT